MKRAIFSSVKAAALAIFAVTLFAMPTFAVVPAAGGGGAASPDQKNALCEGATGDTGCTTTGPTLMGTIGNITQMLLYVAGAVAVIMIIIGGVRYATSGGDQSGVTSAKNTILYAVIGLVVTILAYAIVHFVLGNIK